MQSTAYFNVIIALGFAMEANLLNALLKTKLNGREMAEFR